MKAIWTNYTFNATAKTITFNSLPSGYTLDIKRILAVINVTIERIIYSPSDPSLAGTISGSVLTLTNTISGQADADQLMIVLDFPEGTNVDSFVPTLLQPTSGLGYMYNGSNWDRVRNNSSTTITSGQAISSSSNTGQVSNFNHRGGIIYFDVSGLSGTGTVTFRVQTLMPGGGSTWVDLPGSVQTPAINANGTYQLAIMPGITPVTNQAFSSFIPRNFRIAYTVSGTLTCNLAAYVQYVL